MAVLGRELFDAMHREFQYEMAVAMLPDGVADEVIDQIAEDLGLKVTRTVAEEE